MLFNVLNDEFVVGHIGFTAVTFSSVYAYVWSAVAVHSVDAIFENKYFAR